MNDLDKFLEIPTKEISQRTHILEEVIDRIKNKKFSEIKIRTHFYGFVSSISSEYELDIVEELLNEYDDFYNIEHKINTYKKVEKKEVVIKKETNNKSFKKVAKKEQNINNNIEQDKLEDTKINDGNSILIVIVIISLSIALFVYITQDNKDSTKVKKKEIIQKVDYAKKVNTVEINTTKIIIKKPKPKPKKYTFSTKNRKIFLNITDNTLYFEPFKNNKLWIGVIDLDNKKQVGEILKGLTSYNIKSNTIFSTGHGYLNISNGEEKKSYKTLAKLYFYYKNNVLYKIKKKDVMALNGGYLW